MVSNKSVADRARIVTALEMILNGKNKYYVDKLKDKDFVHAVRCALEQERTELEDLKEELHGVC